MPGPWSAHRRSCATSPSAGGRRPSGEKFVTLVENSTDFIGMCDMKGVPFFVNRAGLDMVGLDNIEDARRPPWTSSSFRKISPGSCTSSFRRSSRRGHGEIEVRFRHFKTGEARWMSYKVLVLRDAAGKPTGSGDGQPGRHRAQAAGRQPPATGGGSLRGRPPQGRIPGDARARTAQPAGAAVEHAGGAERADGDSETLIARVKRWTGSWRNWSGSSMIYST